jgi:hypothetical protein
MITNILDAPEAEKAKNQTLKTLKDGLPILILLAVVCYSIFTFATTDNNFTLSKQIGIASIFLSALIFFFFNRTIGACFFISVLFLSLFGLIKFTVTYTTLSFLGITLPPFPTFMFIFSFFWQKSYLQIGLTKFKNIKIIKKIIDLWQSIPD